MAVKVWAFGTLIFLSWFGAPAVLEIPKMSALCDYCVGEQLHADTLCLYPNSTQCCRADNGQAEYMEKREELWGDEEERKPARIAARCDSFGYWAFVMVLWTLQFLIAAAVRLIVPLVSVPNKAAGQLNLLWKIDVAQLVIVGFFTLLGIPIVDDADGNEAMFFIFIFVWSALMGWWSYAVKCLADEYESDGQKDDGDVEDSGANILER